MTPPPAPPTPVQSLRARSGDGTELQVEIHGNPNGPTVVFSHGWTCSIRFWWPVIAELGAEYRLVAYDQRGHGGSDRPGKGSGGISESGESSGSGRGTGTGSAGGSGGDGGDGRGRGGGRANGQPGYSVPALAADLAAVLDAAAGPGEVILVGHSMGAMTVMAAGQDPAIRARTRAILLASTGAHGLATRANLVPTRPLARIVSRRMLRDASPLGPRTRLSTKLLAYGTLGPKPDRALAIENATIIHACPRQTRAGWGRVLETLDVREGAAALTAPTAVLVGTADRLTPPHHAEEIAQLLPNLHSKTVLKGIGHMSPMEDPATVAALVRELDGATKGDGEAATVQAAAVPAAAEPAAVQAATSPVAPSLAAAPPTAAPSTKAEATAAPATAQSASHQVSE